MGRAKLNMELIHKEKSRNTTFKKRKEGLIRKMHEFTTLCDVRACMIIYGPKPENGPVEPEIWPQNIKEVHGIIDIYKSKKKDSGHKTFGLTDFFHERKRKIEDELSKLRKRNMEAKYPTRVEHMNKNEGQLRAFASALGNKVDLVRSKIEMLKRSSGKQGVVMDINAGQFYPHPPHDMHVPFPIYYPTTVDHQQQKLSVNQNSMMMLMMNGEDQFGLGGASSSNVGANIQCASFKQQIFYERTLPLPRYYVPPLTLPPPPPYMVAPFTTGSWENQDVSREDVVQYQMKIHRG
ncbi:hypothetical protein ACS0TY_006282 [Phlomoides rotata]